MLLVLKPHDTACISGRIGGDDRPQFRLHADSHRLGQIHLCDGSAVTARDSPGPYSSGSLTPTRATGEPALGQGASSMTRS